MLYKTDPGSSHFEGGSKVCIAVFGIGKASLKTIMDTKLIIAEEALHRESEREKRVGWGWLAGRAAQVCFPGVRLLFA
jgi:hypothetical protein